METVLPRTWLAQAAHCNQSSSHGHGPEMPTMAGQERKSIEIVLSVPHPTPIWRMPDPDSTWCATWRYVVPGTEGCKPRDKNHDASATAHVFESAMKHLTRRAKTTGKYRLNAFKYLPGGDITFTIVAFPFDWECVCGAPLSVLPCFRCAWLSGGNVLLL